MIPKERVIAALEHREPDRVPTGENAVDYELVKRDSGWLVFNVVIEGVSYVRNFRAELDAEIRGSSLEAVITRLEREANIATESDATEPGSVEPDAAQAVAPSE